MYTPEIDTHNTDKNGTPTSSVDPSYNPYLQESAPESSMNANDNTDSAAETNTNDSSKSAETAKTASWDFSARTDEPDNANAQRCPRCGAMLRPGAKFCVSCGKSLSDSPRGSDDAPDDSTESRQRNPHVPHGTPVPPPDGKSQTPPQYTAKAQVDPTVPEKLSVLDYFVLFLVTNIPVVGVILALYWGFSAQTGINRKNFARTILILRVIQDIVVFLYVLLVVTLMANVIDVDLYNSYHPSIFH